MPFTPELKQLITQTLGQRQAFRACERCGQQRFIVVDGFISPLVQQEPVSVALGSPQLVCAGVICSYCGNLTLHSLAALGFDVNSLITPWRKP